MKSNTNPKVAVITRTKDRGELLARALASVDAQTYENYIHVVINDGGDRRKVEDIIAKHPNSRRIVIHNDISEGPVKSLNRAIRATKSDYITAVDDDDSCSPYMLERHVKTILELNAAASSIPLDVIEEEINANGDLHEIRRYKYEYSWCGEISLFKQCRANYLPLCSLMYRRSIFDELGGYDESLELAEDWDFGLRLLQYYDVEQVISDSGLYNYHRRANAPGALRNNVYDLRRKERTINQIRNKHLREDLKKGVFGIGYIMNNAEYDLTNVIRIEGHINRTKEDILSEARFGRKVSLKKITGRLKGPKD